MGALTPADPGLEPSQEASLLVPRQPGRGGWNQTAGNEYAAVHNATEGLALQEYNTWFGTMPKVGRAGAVGAGAGARGGGVRARGQQA